MKHLFSFLATLIAVRYTFAQTNTFERSGNAEIGTISPPIAGLQIGYVIKGGPSPYLFPELTILNS